MYKTFHYCIYILQSSVPITEVTRSGPHTPYVLIIPDSDQVFLIVDRSVVCEISDHSNIPLYLLGAFYCFNICYTPGCSNYYLFLEFMFLNLAESKLTNSVQILISALENILL